MLVRIHYMFKKSHAIFRERGESNWLIVCVISFAADILSLDVCLETVNDVWLNWMGKMGGKEGGLN
jgi:hypothetical protein